MCSSVVQLSSLLEQTLKFAIEGIETEEVGVVLMA